MVATFEPYPACFREQDDVSTIGRRGWFIGLVAFSSAAGPIDSIRLTAIESAIGDTGQRQGARRYPGQPIEIT